MAYDTPYTPPDMGGNIRPNRFKKPGSKEPDWRGLIKVNGVVLEIAGWLRRDQGNNEFLSLKFSVPRERAPKSVDNDGTPNESIPF